MFRMLVNGARKKRRIGGKAAFAAALVLAGLAAGVIAAQGPGSAGDTIADLVLGAADLTQTYGQSPGPTYISNPQAVAIDRSGPQPRLYVVSPDDNRVLGWDNVPALKNNAPAVLVIGQNDFTSLVGGTGPNQLNSPAGIAVDSRGNLWVSDTANGRVLEYKTPFAAGCSAAAPCKGQAPNLEIGQGTTGKDFTDVGCNDTPGVFTPTAYSLCSPKGLFFDANDNLFVGDWNNYRVLEFEAPLGSTNGCQGAGSQPGCPGDLVADRVWGQGPNGNEFTLHTGGTGGLSSELGSADSVAVDSRGTLYVTDSANSDVLAFQNAASNFAPNLLFRITTAPGSPIALGLGAPTGVAIDAKDNVYIADTGGGRVLEYDDPTALSNGCPGVGTQPGCPGDTIPDRVFGQPDFMTVGCNSGEPFLQTSAELLCAPARLALDANGDLFVPDSDNKRVLEYLNPLASPGAPTPTPTAGGGPSATPTPTPTATATPNVAQGELSAPREVNFGNAVYGGGPGLGAAVSKTVVVANKSKSATVPISASATGAFAVTAGGGAITRAAAPRCTGFLAPGGKCSLTLTFTPGGFGTSTGHLTVDGLTLAVLNGNGAHGAIGFSPKALNFTGKVPLRQPRTKTVTLSNRNPVGLVVSAILSSDPLDFSASQNCVGTLGTGANASCQITVTFQPPVAGRRKGKLLIVDAGGTGSQEIPLSGIGR